MLEYQPDTVTPPAGRPEHLLVAFQLPALCRQYHYQLEENLVLGLTLPRDRDGRSADTMIRQTLFGNAYSSIICPGLAQGYRATTASCSVVGTTSNEVDE